MKNDEENENGSKKEKKKLEVIMIEPPTEIFINQYPGYVAKYAHQSYKEAQEAAHGTPVKTLRYVLSQVEEGEEDGTVRL